VHELSIALGIIDVAAEELARQGSVRVEAVHLRVGALSGVVPEALESAWELAAEQSPLAGARLVIEKVPVEVECPVCGGRRQVESIQRMCCRACGTPSAEVVRGRELEVVAMEVCDEPAAAPG
jgi:hydrogenase nickel incorporation protein HypA/HybF